MAITAHMSDQY